MSIKIERPVVIEVVDESCPIPEDEIVKALDGQKTSYRGYEIILRIVPKVETGVSSGW